MVSGRPGAPRGGRSGVGGARRLPASVVIAAAVLVVLGALTLVRWAVVYLISLVKLALLAALVIAVVAFIVWMFSAKRR